MSMYSKKDLNHTMTFMKHWLGSYVPLSGWQCVANRSALMLAFNLLMHRNIHKFGDSFFKQLIRTAMGTYCAVFFANKHFGAHEKQMILPEDQDNLQKDLFPTKSCGSPVSWQTIEIFSKIQGTTITACHCSPAYKKFVHETHSRIKTRRNFTNMSSMKSVFKGLSG